MANFQTVKNTLRKLETRQKETIRPEGCGVIFIDEYEKLPPVIDGQGSRNSKTGYLVVPRPMSIEQWEAEFAR